VTVVAAGLDTANVALKPIASLAATDGDAM
jgi:hypothetical protein